MTTAQSIVSKLHLQPHPEGGWYSEVYRSTHRVISENQHRSAMTSIYFLLEEGEVSRWHCVDADEAWHFYEGSQLELLIAPPDFSTIEIITLGEVWDGETPVHVVPAGWWQAARSTGSFSLVGCTVAPGFEFSGFRFLNESETEKMKAIPFRHNPGFDATRLL
jgi:predicted cupin superfamily sugar epimerase